MRPLAEVLCPRHTCLIRELRQELLSSSAVTPTTTAYLDGITPVVPLIIIITASSGPSDPPTALSFDKYKKNFLYVPKIFASKLSTVIETIDDRRITITDDESARAFLRAADDIANG